MIAYFEELLETNGIRIPRTPIRKLMFEHQWAAAETLYSEKIQTRYREKKTFENLYKPEIKKNWNVDIDYPSFETPHFRTPEDAYEKISKIPAPHANAFHDSVVESERSKWVKQIITEAPDTSTLIYIRATDYFTQSANTYFKERMGNKLEACTTMCGICIVYIGFLKSRPLEELNLKYWTIVRNRATVEYV